MSSLEDYTNPEVKPIFIEVAKTDGFPRLLRVKAINSLVQFKDKTVLDELIPMLEDFNNYDYYYEIINLAKDLGASSEYNHKINLAAYKAYNESQQ